MHLEQLIIPEAICAKLDLGTRDEVIRIKKLPL